MEQEMNNVAGNLALDISGNAVAQLSIITDYHRLLMAAKILPMALYVTESENRQLPRIYQVMHDKCAEKKPVADKHYRFVQKRVDNPRAVCIVCNLEYDKAAADKERKLINKWIAEGGSLKLSNPNPAK